MNKSFSYFALLIKLMVLLICTNTLAGNIRSDTRDLAQITEIDQYVEQIMKRQGIPGVAVAVLKEGKVIHQNYYGYANIEHQVAVQSKTIFPLLSTTKIPVTTAIFKLIEEGKISLQDKVGKYIVDIPDDWKDIEIKYLLAHASGLPDVVKYDKQEETTMKQKIYKEDFVFSKGESFNYNQTNFWLLAKVIEKVSAQTFETYLLASQFNDDQSSAVFSTNMLEIIPNRATRYTYFNDRKQFEVDQQINGRYLNSCNGLNVSLNDFIMWTQKFEKNGLINAKSKEHMWKKFNYSKNGPDFAYGWEVHETNGHLSYGFSGGYTTAFRTFADKKLTVIWLSNGFKKFYRTDPVIDYLAGLADVELKDHEAVALEKVSQAFFQKPVQDSIVKFKHIKNEYPQVDFSQVLHHIASGLLDNDQYDESLLVNDLNINEYPDHWLGYYGRANAYKKHQDHDKAIVDFNKAAELHTDVSVQQQLKKMASELKI